MSIFKCKMCGGTIEFNLGDTVGICDSCGTKQTLPRLDDDKKVNLYDRANHFRRNNEFDKAMAIYEQILLEDNTDAEAYWSLVLCRYGIEYVEDPMTHKRVPTVNRAQFTSIFADEDYKSALQYADGYQKEIYEQEAKAIDEIQKGILEISSKEEPFDIFICYKETDNNGRRTQDSVLATDLYHQLTQEGFKVFFSRITLEDKLGTAYEPYIFAALNSAKVMVVLGTKPEYFNAVWVKNEWSRYLALVKQSNGKKILIPAYRDMDPYDLPEEFSHLQAQDMSKLGFMQDLIRGIKKIVNLDENKPVEKTIVVQSDKNNTIEPLLKRAFMFLEDGEFSEASEYCEKVLDQDPECARAYLGKLMAELGVTEQKSLKHCENSFDNNTNYLKAIRFGNEELVSELKSYVSHIEKRNEMAHLIEVYNSAVQALEAAKTEEECLYAAESFAGIQDFRDAVALRKKCLEKAEVCRNDAIYASAEKCMETHTIESYEAALEQFRTILEWKDSPEKINLCQCKIEEIKKKQEKKRIETQRRKKKCKKIAIIVTPIVCVMIAFVILLKTWILPTIRFDKNMRALSKAEVGSTVTFGVYEQDNNNFNEEEIEWIVLEKADNKVLLLSKYALDCQPYNTEFVDVTWETCSLRKWLNETFLKEAFKGSERAVIQTTTVVADQNPECNTTNPGNATNDKVFLLSISEVEKYFTADEKRRCVPTKYALQQGAYTNDEYTLDGQATCVWWLRLPGSRQTSGVVVTRSGQVTTEGRDVSSKKLCVRPALWINLKP